jgi:hypothetical protein
MEANKAEKVQVTDDLEQNIPFSIGRVPQVGVYEDDDEEDVDEEDLNGMFAVDMNAVDLESADDYEDPEFSDSEMQEAARLIALVQQGTSAATPTMKDKTGNNPTKLQVNLKSKKTRRDTT